MGRGGGRVPGKIRVGRASAAQLQGMGRECGGGFADANVRGCHASCHPGAGSHHPRIAQKLDDLRARFPIKHHAIPWSILDSGNGKPFHSKTGTKIGQGARKIHGIIHHGGTRSSAVVEHQIVFSEVRPCRPGDFDAFI